MIAENLINASSIAIDTYDDIFSDFDPRDISQAECPLCLKFSSNRGDNITEVKQ
jgi:hypothetical protein